MEAEFQDFTDQMFRCKGKRTKRPRASPSIGVAVDSNPIGASPSIGMAVDSNPIRDCPSIGVAVDSSPFGDGDAGGCDDYYSSFVHSPASSCSQISTATEEDENMANCLILLARSGCSKQDANNDVKVEKITCRKFSSGTAAIAAATSVYECKTCNRKFPSFQALGGHRASHSKPKLMPENHKKTTPSDHHHHHRDQDNHKESQNKKLNKTKIHECSVCGSEFYSGQALGGHMRRHRPLHINTTTNMKASIDDYQEKPRPIFTLDLNLPAPEEDEVDDDDNTMFEFSAKQQSSTFSCPAFVDCHY